MASAVSLFTLIGSILSRTPSQRVWWAELLLAGALLVIARKKRRQ